MTVRVNSRLTAALDFSNRGVMVTGGASGIGLAACRLFLAHGAMVTIVDRDEDSLRRAGEQLGEAARVELLAADVGVEAEVRGVFESLGSTGRTVDALVNNVGTGARKPSLELDTDTWNRVLGTNLTSAFLCSREFAKQVEPGRGTAIVNVASIMGLVGNSVYPNLSYHATKGGLVNMTRALAVEWAPSGVRVNAVAPTFVETALTSRLLADSATREAILRKTPLRRLADPQEVANGIVFLASDAAAMITGTILPIDGGWLAE